MGYNFKMKKFLQTGDPSHWLLDKILFRQGKQLLGNRCNWIMNGSAPLAPHVNIFLKIFLGVNVQQGNF